MSAGRHPGRPRSSRLALTASLAALLAVLGGFAWVAFKSYDLLYGDRAGSDLKPVKVTGPEELVFQWRKDSCEPEDLPDIPARAFRDARGRTHLIASHYVSRQAIGPDLDRVEHRCQVVMRSADDPDPARWAYREWIFGPYTPDGRNVFALVHNEYHGDDFPGLCPSQVFERCWYNGVTLARSDDGGATFRHARPPPDHLVAAVPYRYMPDAGQVGVFGPSNIVQKDGYYYALVAVTKYRAQERGACLIRTNDLEDPASWRAWDGDGFETAFADPYADRVDPPDHVCEPVSPRAISDMRNSLTYNTYFDKYLLVGNSRRYIPAERRVVSGFYYSLSEDLIDWSEPRLIKEVVLIQNFRCGDPDPVYYASVLDPDSDSRNYETSGRRPYIYFTRLHYEACVQTLDRDLVRVPVEFSK